MTKPEDAASVHSGHRQRLKDQFLTHGMDPIHDVNVLELILFYAIPRQDTNPIAHRLLSTFGSLAAVFDATPEELMERGGLSKNAATLIKLIPAAARRQQLSRSSCHQLLDSTQKCGDYLVPFFFGATQEEVFRSTTRYSAAAISWSSSFWSSVRPRFRFFRTLMKSSRKPMIPKIRANT